MTIQSIRAVIPVLKTINLLSVRKSIKGLILVAKTFTKMRKGDKV